MLRMQKTVGLNPRSEATDKVFLPDINKSKTLKFTLLFKKKVT